jgi:hypothetical protein
LRENQLTANSVNRLKHKKSDTPAVQAATQQNRTSFHSGLSSFPPSKQPAKP